LKYGANAVALQEEHVSKRARTADPPDPTPAQSNSGFPANFFSDPSRAIPVSDGDGEDREPSGAPSNPPVNPQLDLEWAQFERDLLAHPAAEDQRHEIYYRATLIAEPQLVEEALPEGFPPSAAPARGAVNGAAEPKLGPEGEDQETKRREEEKELIMDRILEEERAQEDADERVAALKARLAAVKAKRAAAKAMVHEVKDEKS
jgi:zinc finger protein 830